MAVQDWLVLGFHGYMWLRVLMAPDTHEASLGRRISGLLLTVSLCAIVAARGELLRKGLLRNAIYRVGLFAPMLASYFELRYLLPALQPRLLDAQLMAIDRAIFGVTPAVWLGQFNTRPVVEWFSFFYYSYFYILGLVSLPALFFGRTVRTHALLVGAALVCAGGHVGYTLVPGLGPYASIHFEDALHGGPFLDLVLTTVGQAGAMLDIFPSLHTAYPTYFALFAFSQRDALPWKFAWPVLAFFAANIIVATMFLRWHWGIDVAAGLALAFTASRMGLAIARFEEDRGPDRQPVWPRLF